MQRPFALPFGLHDDVPCPRAQPLTLSALALAGIALVVGLWLGATWAEVTRVEVRDPRAQATVKEAMGRLAGGLLAGGAVLALPLGALGCLAWVRRRRRRPAVVLARLGGRCAFCHDDAFGVAAPCVECGSLLHATCWLEAARCPTLGCRGGPNARFALAPGPATIQLGGPPSGGPRSA